MALAQGEATTDIEPGAPGRILLVDDQPELRRLFRRSLARLGHEVVEAWNGRAAVELAQQSQFDDVISDVRMPDMDGLELLHELAELDPDLPVMLVSGGIDSLAEQAAVEYGAFAYLMKPISFETLSDCAADAIELRRTRGESREKYEPYASMKRLKIPAPEAARDRRKR